VLDCNHWARLAPRSDDGGLSDDTALISGFPPCSIAVSHNRPFISVQIPFHGGCGVESGSRKRSRLCHRLSSLMGLEPIDPPPDGDFPRERAADASAASIAPNVGCSERRHVHVQRISAGLEGRSQDGRSCRVHHDGPGVVQGLPSARVAQGQRLGAAREHLDSAALVVLAGVKPDRESVARLAISFSERPCLRRLRSPVERRLRTLASADTRDTQVGLRLPLPGARCKPDPYASPAPSPDASREKARSRFRNSGPGSFGSDGIDWPLLLLAAPWKRCV
jgi:hypothetical protein